MTRLSYEIIERSPDLTNVALIGIKTRGVPLAKIIKGNILLNAGKHDEEQPSQDAEQGNHPGIDCAGRIHHPDDGR